MKYILPLLIITSVLVSACNRAPSQPEATPVVEITPSPASQSFEFTATQDNISAYDLLQSSATIEAQQYDFGAFVTSINGVTPPEGSFWSLYLNNEKAQVGASDLQLKVGDVTTWKIESIE